MKKFELLKEIIPYLEEFDARGVAPNGDIQDFSLWLNRRLEQERNYNTDPKTKPNSPEVTPEVLITTLITHLYRYARHYVKKALAGSKLISLDDFVFLITLLYQGQQTKSQIIHQHLMDFSTGISVINRLKKNGFLDEETDSEDRRTRRLRITPDGSAELDKVMARMEDVTHIVAGQLSDLEKRELILVLQQLDSLHRHIYTNHLENSLPEIRENFIEGSTAADSST